VFVLATTDPQKVSDTIRSRTQHLQFHLLPADVLEAHVRWLAADAGIDVDDAAVQQVLRQGGGSARDTISALELVAAGGGVAGEITPLDEFVESFIEHDPGRALSAVAHSVQHGRDPRALTEEIIRHLRDCFLSLMAPELVQLSGAREQEVQQLASRLGAPALVRALERLGEMLTEMRHAPDPRVLLEVALVQLTHDPANSSVTALMARVERLEQQIAGAAAAPAAPPTPPPTTAADAQAGRAKLGERARKGAADLTGGAPRPTAPEPAPPAAPAAATASSGDIAARWTADVLPTLKSTARAMYSPLAVVGVRDGRLVLAAPDESTRNRVELRRPEVEAALAAVAGSKVPLEVVVDGAAHDDAPLPSAEIDEIHDIDLGELVDAPQTAVPTPIDRLHEAFPGSTELPEGR
jgi:DNA polymerase III subunit gamma/tau